MKKMFAAAAAKSLQSCPTVCDPIDGSPPGSPAPGILQAKTLDDDHALITWISCTDHVADHTLFTCLTMH